MILKKQKVDYQGDGKTLGSEKFFEGDGSNVIKEAVRQILFAFRLHKPKLARRKRQGLCGNDGQNGAIWFRSMTHIMPDWKTEQKKHVCSCYE